MVTLSCTVTNGNPTPTIKWYRDDVFAANGADYTFSASGADHGKVYRCDAANVAGTVSDQITLISECNAVSSQTEDNHYLINFLDKAESVAFTGSDGVVNAAQTVTITCTSVGGYPEPILKIIRDSIELHAGSSPLSYEFTVVAADDGATYECDATNVAGTTSTSLTFDVSRKNKIGIIALSSSKTHLFHSSS